MQLFGSSFKFFSPHPWDFFNSTANPTTPITLPTYGWLHSLTIFSEVIPYLYCYLKAPRWLFVSLLSSPYMVISQEVVNEIQFSPHSRHPASHLMINIIRYIRQHTAPLSPYRLRATHHLLQSRLLGTAISLCRMTTNLSVHVFPLLT
jgi:hypothetical protein